METLELGFRYYHQPRRAGISESDIQHNTLSRSLRPDEIALILVDVWSDHYIATHLQRGREITLERIKPVMETFRKVGASVVHAPSPNCAKIYPQWLCYAGDGEVHGRPPSPGDDWPPSDFRNKADSYQKLARPSQPKDREFDGIIQNRRIIPEVEPLEGDDVIVTGDQLHRLLSHRKILYLFYAGFAANMCVPFRDYGMRAMKNRGYEITLIRDCTTAIEVADTADSFSITQHCVIDTELNIGYTVSASELISACEEVA